MKTLALTGATGFVGKATVDAALAQGFAIRALTRRDQPQRDGVTWVRGDLGNHDALRQLADGADVVVHIAGVVNAPTPAGFIAGNVDGTRAMVEAATDRGVRRFVHVSSLSAREPELSNYGRSKQLAEEEVRKSTLNWVMVRPPGVYGPGDMEMRDVFRLAKKGLAVMPPAGRVSLIHVQDLARLLVALAVNDTPQTIYDCDDGHDGGYTHAQFARMIGAAFGRKPLVLHVPAPILRLTGRMDGLLRREQAKLTPDRAAYLSHPDWTATPANRPPAHLWTPQIATAKGIAQTADWYRANAFL